MTTKLHFCSYSWYRTQTFPSLTCTSVPDFFNMMLCMCFAYATLQQLMCIHGDVNTSCPQRNGWTSAYCKGKFAFLRKIALIGLVTFFVEINDFCITLSPFPDNGSANAETFPYNETQKVTAALKGKNPSHANKTDKRPKIIY